MEEQFKFSDAWVFVSLLSYKKVFKPINLSNIIVNGDALNHAIFEINELRQGLEKLLLNELIEIDSETIRFTEKGNYIKKEINSKGGLFSKIENALKLINKLPKSNKQIDCGLSFLSEEKFTKAYELYSGNNN